MLGTSWKRHLENKGAEVIVWDLPEVDITDKDSIVEASRGIEPTGIINAAAIDAPPEADPEYFWRILEVNVEGTFNVCEALLPGMQDGAVVNVASMYALVSPFWDKNMAYGASKAAIVQMTKHWACFYPHLRINSVCLGGVDGDQPDWFKEEYSNRLPMQRMAQPSEYDDVIEFMLTTSYMTGSNLVVDGGWTAM